MPDVKTTKEIIKLCYYANVPTYLWGPTAAAKTSLVKQLAKEDLKVPVISLFFQTQEPGDILGLPTVEIVTPKGTEQKIKVTSWAAPEWFRYITDHPKAGIIFGDEANRAQPDTAQTFTCLVTERKFHIHEVPPGWRFIFASNYGSEYDIRELDVAIMARFCHIKVSPTVSEWLAWGGHNMATEWGPIHTKVSQFIKSSPSHLVQGDAAKTKGWEPHPNRRTWEWVSNLLYAYEQYGHNLNPKTKQSVFNAAVQGLVGKGIPTLLSDDEPYLDVLSILKNPDQFNIDDIYRFSKELTPTLVKTKMTPTLYKNLKEILTVKARSRKDIVFNIAKVICKAEGAETWANKMREDEEIKEFYTDVREDAGVN